MTPDSAISSVSPSSKVLRLRVPASCDRNRLVSTASAPEIAMPWPASPSLMPKSCDTGVNRLTGINSEATSAKAQSVIASTPLQYARGWVSSCVVVVIFNRPCSVIEGGPTRCIARTPAQAPQKCGTWLKTLVFSGAGKRAGTGVRRFWLRKKRRCVNLRRESRTDC